MVGARPCNGAALVGGEREIVSVIPASVAMGGGWLLDLCVRRLCSTAWQGSTPWQVPHPSIVAHPGRAPHLEQPGLEVLVDKEVESHELEAAVGRHTIAEAAGVLAHRPGRRRVRLCARRDEARAQRSVSGRAQCGLKAREAPHLGVLVERVIGDVALCGTRN
eukprot:361954-Chlamydomonas_euryale.AAC.4